LLQEWKNSALYIPTDISEKFGFSFSKIEKLNASQQMVLDTILQAYGMMNHRVQGMSSRTIGMYIGNMLDDESFTDYNIASHTECCTSLYSGKSGDSLLNDGS